MRSLVRMGSSVFYAVTLSIGFVVYLVSRKTPPFGYASMIKLFCLTKGHSSDWLSRLIGAARAPYHIRAPSGVLGDMTDAGLRGRVVSQLKDRGYYIFERRLPDDMCDRLLQYAMSHPCRSVAMDGDRAGQPVISVYPRGTARSVRYDFDPQDLLKNVDVQRLLADLSFASVAQDYLGARPVSDVLGMWWHTSFSDKPDMAAAQYYHFDMDRPKWLKFFIYLTDVKSTNGPHTFVAGSHQTGAIPPKLLDKGYARLTDEEVEGHYAESDIIEFAAPRGTIIAEDTRGLHKGKHVHEGDRLMLQIQFSNSLFGGAAPTFSLSGELSAELQRSREQFPGLYAAYQPEGAR